MAEITIKFDTSKNLDRHEMARLSETLSRLVELPAPTSAPPSLPAGVKKAKVGKALEAKGEEAADLAPPVRDLREFTGR